MIEYGIVGLLVLIAILHLVQRLARSARGADSACGASCACGAADRRNDRLGRRIDLVQLGAPSEFELVARHEHDAHSPVHQR